MAVDATGTPSTNFSIPKYNTGSDAPSGKGLNAIIDFIDTLLFTSGTNLGAVGRVGVRANGAGSTYNRRRINFIGGTNVTISIADDSGDEEVEVTITSASANLVKGTATVGIANGASTGSVSVTHGLGATPTAVTIAASATNTVTTSGGATTAHGYITAVGATTFTFNVRLEQGLNNASGSTTNTTWYWMAS